MKIKNIDHFTKGTEGWLGAILMLMMVACSDAETSIMMPHIEPDASLPRPTDPEAEGLRFDADEVVESIESEYFKIHYTRSGRNAVPDIDDNRSGVPDYPEMVLDIYMEVYDAYVDMGFRAPLPDDITSGENGGDERFDIYLVDFSGRGDGQFRAGGCLVDEPRRCSGYMLQENDFEGYGYSSIEVASRIVGSHEFFHAVQAGYTSGQDVIVSEATAVWATERFDATLNDFEGFVRLYLGDPSRSLFVNTGGVTDGFPYSVALFFRFLDEYIDEDVVRLLWEEMQVSDAETRWLDSLDVVLQREYDEEFSDAFSVFSVWNIYTGDRAKLSEFYFDGARYPEVASLELSLPGIVDRPRLFASSARYWQIDLDSVTELSVSVSVDGVDAEALEHFQVRLARVIDGNIEIVELVSNETQILSVQGADSAILMLVNANKEGVSIRPVVSVEEK
ncbi:MAG: hypothetical protein KTR25_17420 [Myxococcales bacterium]|nr:hypothetical protein [Myxococcales bacterium]